MYSARIENEELVLQTIGFSANGSEATRIRLTDISEFFISGQSGINNAYIQLRMNPSLLPERDHMLITGNVEINALFNQVSGFIGIDTLTYGIPMELLGDSEEYGRNLLTQALKDGIKKGDTLTIEYGDNLPEGLGEERQTDRVHLSRAFILPEAVEFIMDQGEYRDIYFKADRGEKIALPLHTAEEKHSLEKRLGHLRLN